MTVPVSVIMLATLSQVVGELAEAPEPVLDGLTYTVEILLTVKVLSSNVYVLPLLSVIVTT